MDDQEHQPSLTKQGKRIGRPPKAPADRALFQVKTLAGMPQRLRAELQRFNLAGMNTEQLINKARDMGYYVGKRHMQEWQPLNFYVEYCDYLALEEALSDDELQELERRASGTFLNLVLKSLQQMEALPAVKTTTELSNLSLVTARTIQFIQAREKMSLSKRKMLDEIRKQLNSEMKVVFADHPELLAQVWDVMDKAADSVAESLEARTNTTDD